MYDKVTKIVNQILHIYRLYLHFKLYVFSNFIKLILGDKDYEHATQ